MAVAPAGSTDDDLLAAHGTGLVAVVTPRRSDEPTRSAPEVLGVVDVDRLRSSAPADDVVRHAGDPPPAVGDGERVADAHARVPDGPVLVLRDGRVVALTTRAALEHPATRAG